MASRPRFRLGSPDALLVLAVLVFAGALVLLVGRSERAGEPPAPPPREAPQAASSTATGAGGATREAPGPRAAPAANAVPRPRVAPGDELAARAPAEAEAHVTGAIPTPVAAGAGEDEKKEGEEPAKRLAIRGRVLDADGKPVVGLPISARPLEGTSRAERKVRSGADGSYVFARLAPGRYRLSTEETANHPSRSTVARAGSEGVDLLLAGRVSLQVRGRITDSRDAPVAGVAVQPFGHSDKAVSDTDGRYELHFAAQEGPEFTLLRFQAEGYADHEVRVARSELSGEGAERNVRLEPAEGRFVVRGRLRPERGELPASINVMLRSTKLRSTLHGLAGADGHFQVLGVEEAHDWRVSVRPGQGFRDTALGPLHLHERSDVLEISLAAIDTGSVAGRLLDPEGRPLPNFVMTLSSDAARSQSRELRSDGDGHFLIEDVPAGPLRFETRSVPHLRVAGLDLGPGEREDVDLVLDVGEQSIEGQVLGERGRPVAGAEVRLDWQHVAGGTRSSSFRRTLSDSEGRFRFRQLGPGPHGLAVRAAEHRPWRAQVAARDARAGLEVRLEPGP